jgi:hypothetical protein
MAREQDSACRLSRRMAASWMYAGYAVASPLTWPSTGRWPWQAGWQAGHPGNCAIEGMNASGAAFSGEHQRFGGAFSGTMASWGLAQGPGGIVSSRR